MARSWVSELAQGEELPWNGIWPALEFTWQGNKSLLVKPLSFRVLFLQHSLATGVMHMASKALQTLTPALVSSLFNSAGKREDFHFLQGMMLSSASVFFPLLGSVCLFPFPPPTHFFLAKSYSSSGHKPHHHFLRETPIAFHQLSPYTSLQLLVFSQIRLLCFANMQTLSLRVPDHWPLLSSSPNTAFIRPIHISLQSKQIPHPLWNVWSSHLAAQLTHILRLSLNVTCSVENASSFPMLVTQYLGLW